jgi:aminoglycoside phosphotransferase (APT) family kinase protein
MGDLTPRRLAFKPQPPLPSPRPRTRIGIRDRIRDLIHNERQATQSALPGPRPGQLRAAWTTAPGSRQVATRSASYYWRLGVPRLIGETGSVADRDRLFAAVRAYASDVMGLAPAAITAVTAFEDGNRHGVYRVSYRDASDVARDVVVRVSYSGDTSELAQAEREAAVLKSVGGVAAPELYDFRRTSDWFNAPAMCIQFLPGRQQDLQTVGSTQIEQLGALVAWVHARPLDALAGLDSSPTPASSPSPSSRPPTTIATYAEDRLQAILSTLTWARDPLPRTLQDRLRRAADSLTASFAAVRASSDSFDSGEPLSLLHGDIAPGNVLWSPEPCLIDWEYARLGDPADEMAYTFDQNALTSSQRQAFRDGYRQGIDNTARPQLTRIIERVEWWEPVTLLGSALWWVERWVRRTELDAEGGADPEVPRDPDYYFERVISRVDRLESCRPR